MRSQKFSGSTRQRTAEKAETESRLLPKHGELLETMIEDTCKLDVDGDGQCEYHGGFGGLGFLHQIGKRFSQLLETDLSKEMLFVTCPFNGPSVQQAS